MQLNIQTRRQATAPTPTPSAPSRKRQMRSPSPRPLAVDPPRERNTVTSEGSGWTAVYTVPDQSQRDYRAVPGQSIDDSNTGMVASVLDGARRAYRIDPKF